MAALAELLVAVRGGASAPPATLDLLMPRTVAKGEPEFRAVRHVLHAADGSRVAVDVPPASVARVLIELSAAKE